MCFCCLSSSSSLFLHLWFFFSLPRAKDSRNFPRSTRPPSKLWFKKLWRCVEILLGVWYTLVTFNIWCICLHVPIVLTYIYIYIYIPSHTQTHSLTHMHTHTCIQYIHTLRHTHTHTHTYVCIYIYTTIHSTIHSTIHTYTHSITNLSLSLSCFFFFFANPSKSTEHNQLRKNSKVHLQQSSFF